MNCFRHSHLDLFFSCVGPLVFLLDVGLDVWAAVNFYQNQAYGSLAVLLVLLLGSSVLVQVYSWLWYSYEGFSRVTRVEGCLGVNQLRLLHLLQLGIFLRHAAVLELSIRSLRSEKYGGFAVYLSNDLSMLKIIETFSESAPQLVLMLTIILQEERVDTVTVLKAVGSASAITLCLTTYHRSLRSFLPEKKMQTSSSLVYFLWNLLLISSRLVALALFASVLPCFIFTHFVCSWMLFFFFAWRSKTSFMDSTGGEWLYRATVGLIWYFHRFNVSEGRTRNKSLLYHGYMLLDISILCGVWCWKMITDPPYGEGSHLYTTITAACVVAVYILGLLLEIIYYKCFHPTISKEELKGDSVEDRREPQEEDVERCASPEEDVERCASPEEDEERCASPEEDEERCASPEEDEERCASPEKDGERCASPEEDEERCASPEEDEERCASPKEDEERCASSEEDEVNSCLFTMEGAQGETSPPACCNKRMRKLAEDFYC